MDEARRVEARERRDQSNLPSILTLSWPTPLHFEQCPRRDVRREPRRIDGARRVSERERANQSNLREELPSSWPTLRQTASCPRRNGAAGKRATWTKPEGRTSGRERVNRTFVVCHHYVGQCLRRVVICPRRESNPHLRFRKPLFFPLNYGDH
jgi:hypothetical protein